MTGGPDSPENPPEKGPDGPEPETAETEGDAESENEEWQFTLQDIEEREAEAAEEDEGERPVREPIETGAPSAENVAFVLLGVLFTLFVLSRLVFG